jgi:hypothetical protein
MKYTQFVAIAENVTYHAILAIQPQLLRLLLQRLSNQTL